MNHRKARGGIIEGLEKLESIYCYILESIFLKCLVKYWWQYRCQKTFDFQEVIHLATYPFWIWIDFHVKMKYLWAWILDVMLIALVSNVTLLVWLSNFAQCWLPCARLNPVARIPWAPSTAQILKVTLIEWHLKLTLLALHQVFTP